MSQIVVQDTPITVMQINEEDYISLTDMMKAKDGDFFFHNWLRNRNTIEFLGIWCICNWITNNRINAIFSKLF